MIILRRIDVQRCPVVIMLAIAAIKREPLLVEYHVRGKMLRRVPVDWSVGHQKHIASIRCDMDLSKKQRIITRLIVRTRGGNHAHGAVVLAS